MLRHLYYPLVLGASLLAAQPAAAFLVGGASDYEAPATGTARGPTASRQSEYQMGYDLGYEQGFGQGLSAGVAECVADPNACGIALNQATPVGHYAETEPNDDRFNADALINGTPFRAQSSGTEDSDWFKLTVSGANRAMTLNFALADAATGNLSGWTITVTNTYGVSQGVFNTGAWVVADTLDGTDYQLTLGREGVYYIHVKPLTNALNYQPYTITATMDASPTDPDTGSPTGHYDAETEPNNSPAQADQVNESISMYGLINLTFDYALPNGANYEWAQGEPDWFYFESPGNQVLNLTFCDRQVCSAGNWLVQLFDEDRAMNPGNYVPIDADTADPFDAAALASFNTTTCGGAPCAPGIAVDEPKPWHFGVSNSGNYYIRVNHERLLTAPCSGYTIDNNNNGAIDQNETDACGCESGYSCDIEIENDSCEIVAGETVCDEFCEDGSGGGSETQCTVGCICTSFSGVVELPTTTDGSTYTSQYNFSLTTNPFASPPPTDGN
ncbi:hypothetical protein [Rhabdochromatium marinum]|uniref:hypothetical protein n=1 Tax=Rhabdochromatium marinum TaxID=48729 RepID=UPI0019058D02|nr:hypothetical protein [Rhabdochromatium marinum]MBK1649454.1 hypothetical protein [Rhabdochromatium marinum]